MTLTAWLLFFCAAAAPAALFAQPSPDHINRVLIVYENESTLAAAVEVAQGLRTSMRQNMPAKLEIYSDYLDIVRFPDADRIERLADDLAAKYKDISFDVVMTVGPGALKFILEHRERLGKDTPIVFGAVSDNSLRNRLLPPDAKGVVSHFDVRKTIDLAATLQPDARNIVVMTGSSAFDQNWQDSARVALADSYTGLRVTYLSGLSIDGFKAAARDLPAQTILLILTIFEDAVGQKFVPRDAAEQIAAVSSAPVYAVYGSYLGTGVVGGYVGTFHTIGNEMGALAAQVVKGDLSAPQASLVKDGPLVDWRQIVRWGIDPERVPKNAEIQNYEKSPWQRYRVEILTMLVVFLLQSATIVALFVQHRRRRRLEAELSLERLELAYLSRTSQLGELSGALAHELNQPLTSILANAEAGSRLLDVEPLDLHELRDILGDIVLDNKRAVSVITQLRRLMIRGETCLEPMDFNQAVTTTLALARSELLARQTYVDLMLDMPDVPVRANLAQLQQVILNLLLNATDAMAHLPPSMREIAIQTRKRDNGFCELTVTDRGVGIPPEQRSEVFKPFVSTKKTSLGLGLAICRSIAQAHGGTLRFDDNFDKGARAIFKLPSA
jgi:signal transduction histidine kinase